MFKKKNFFLIPQLRNLQKTIIFVTAGNSNTQSIHNHCEVLYSVMNDMVVFSRWRRWKRTKVEEVRGQRHATLLNCTKYKANAHQANMLSWCSVLCSVRVVVAEHEHDGNELQVTQGFRTHVAKKLETLLDM